MGSELTSSANAANWSTPSNGSTLLSNTLISGRQVIGQGNLFLLPDEDGLPMAWDVGLHLSPGVQHQLPFSVAETHGVV